jgi:hypothetical protein
MKKVNFLFLSVLGILNLSYAQCSMNASGFGNNTNVPSYNIQGSVAVVLNTNNTVTINLMSNFATASGPDVRLFLVDRGNLTTNQLKIPAMFNARPKIEMGLLSQFTGASSFTQNIPIGMNISDFETVYFYCQAFNAFWDFGSYIPFNTSNCQVLSTDAFQSSKLKIFPNPVMSELQISFESDTLPYKIQIYNTLGGLVFEKNSQVQDLYNKIDISNINSGIYFLRIIDSTNHIYQKRIVKY